MSNPVDDIIKVMDEVRKFVQCNFALGAKGDESGMSPPCKQALAKWQRFYHSKINGPGQIVSHLLPLVDKCEVIEADSLKSSKSHLVKQVTSLKSKFDSCFESLLNKLNSLTGSVLMNALGDNPQ